MAEQRREVFEYFDPNKAPGEAILIGATKVRRQNLSRQGEVTDIISIQPVYSTDVESFKIFEQFEPNYRKALAQKLKSAGYYKGPITGEATRNLREAYLNAQSDLGEENRNRLIAFEEEGQQDLDNIETFLTRQSRGKGGDGIKVQKSVQVADETRARTLINAVLQDAIGRGATQQELKKYTSLLQQAQRDAPTITTSKTSGDVTTFETEGGLDESQFLIQEISGTDEAKANKVFNYYNAFKNALGVS